ncbi:MAG: hypothetical protein ACI4FO_09315 [Acutalibacteraceae bacterium]
MNVKELRNYTGKITKDSIPNKLVITHRYGYGECYYLESFLRMNKIFEDINLILYANYEVNKNYLLSIKDTCELLKWHLNGYFNIVSIESPILSNHTTFSFPHFPNFRNCKCKNSGSYVYHIDLYCFWELYSVKLPLVLTDENKGKFYGIMKDIEKKINKD